ncbi:MAG: hypothetical protein H0U38_02485, partial [Chloroflexia bacterium]|nr:hypothetical protein [Chloroflexia bacterium]
MSTRTVQDDKWGSLEQPVGARSDATKWVLLAIRYTLLIALTVVFMFPFYLIVRNSLMTQPEITGFDWVWWPAEAQWSNFANL